MLGTTFKGLQPLNSICAFERYVLYWGNMTDVLIFCVLKPQVSRNADHHPAFVAVYNMDTTEIVSFYQVNLFFIACFIFLVFLCYSVFMFFSLIYLYILSEFSRRALSVVWEVLWPLSCNIKEFNVYEFRIISFK